MLQTQIYKINKMSNTYKTSTILNEKSKFIEINIDIASSILTISTLGISKNNMKQLSYRVRWF